MSKEVTVTAVCENSGTLHDRELATEEHTGLLDGEQVMVDVCPKCLDGVVAPYLALLAKGTPVPRPVATNRRARGGQATDAVWCPDPNCTRPNPVKSRTGLGAHARRSHHMTMEQLEGLHGRAKAVSAVSSNSSE